MPGETFPPKHGTSLPLSVVNLHVTAKHHLLERDGRSVTSVCDDLVGLHATSNTTPYLSLFNRIQGFKVGVLQQEQDRSESIVRIRAMRGTFFLVTRTQFPLITRATTPPKASILASLSKWGITIKEFRLLTRLILRSISRRPKTALEIKRESSSEELRSLRLRRGWRLVTRTNLNEVLNLLVRLGRVQSRNQRLDWESIDWDGYGSRWFASIKKVLYSTPSMKIEDSTGVVDARAKLVELYIRRYGPVTVRDIAWWIDENETATRKLLKSLTGELVTVQVADLSDELLIHKDELEAVQNVQKGSSVHFLPYEDPYSKGFKLRERLIPPRLEKLVYPMGNALPTVIVDGMIVGTWNVSVDHDELRLNVGKLVPLEKRAESRIVEEGLSLGKFLAKDVKVRVSIGSETTSKWQTISLSSSRAARSRRLE